MTALATTRPGARAARRASHTRHHHVSSLRLLVSVLVALLALTALTVYTARYVHLGETGNLAAAIAIAMVKAGLVVAFFMHLAHDRPFNGVVLFFTLMAIATFLLFTLIDLGSRDAVDPIRNVWTQEPAIVENARKDAEAAESSVLEEPASETPSGLEHE
ncbi:MAG: hypothetical protein D6824_08915 [Planctomycetota bacterium]|nr:MAG: hypothetical protein D6824_08915 [Planctomycetota bacterium]